MNARTLLTRTLIAALWSGIVTLPAQAATTQTGAAQMRWKVAPIITSSLTPNYNSGFGPQGGYGSGVTPAAGSSAALGSGFVDFGSVVAGYNYLYKYAAQLNVTTNDPVGFTVYGEGSTDLNGSSSTVPINTVLFWLLQNSGNSPYSNATPFNKTTFPIAGGGTTINYGASTPPAASRIWSYASPGTAQQGFDYQLRLPGSVPIDSFQVYIVYTVIGN